jgi:hypothetical protein
MRGKLVRCQTHINQLDQHGATFDGMKTKNAIRKQLVILGALAGTAPICW